MSVSVIILTFNSALSIERTIKSVLSLTDDIHVLDSGSIDDTISLASNLGATIHHHAFENYGAQRNWAIENLPICHRWQLHLDADERLTEGLAAEIRKILTDSEIQSTTVGYYIPRLVHFLGQPIKHGGMFPTWHMRLFLSGMGRCEDRKYDQHFFIAGPSAKLSHPMIDDIRMSLTEWTTRHNRWADAEVDEQKLDHQSRRGVISGRLGGTPVEQKRALRAAFDRSPKFYRAFGLFIYRYIVRLGFLDGTPGLIFFILQTFWFRFLIDAKIYEQKLTTMDRN